ncbi:MAG TPA: glycosyltransferase [Solirubrobacteraceae bacterium]|nr:glycosyltransferase [Solirubrobacteraceae bacterium]
MRILQVIESFGGGSMQVALTISERLAAAGHELAVAHGSVAESPRDARAAIPPEIELFEVRWGRAPQNQARAIGELRSIARGWSPDVVHLHSSFAGFAGAIGLRGLAPLVYTPHGYSFIRTGQGRAQETALRLAEAAVARRVDLVGVVSEEERSRAMEIRARRVRVVPNGIAELDDPVGGPPDRPVDPPRVVALGRLDPARRPAAAARIMAGVRDIAAPEWIGGGEESLAEAVRAEGVPTTGWLEREEALRHLGNATACLHWSAWDAQPLSVLEAMARDVVVVASDIGANRELLGSRQVCAREEDARALLREVLTDSALRGRLLEEQRRRRVGYSARRMASQWEEVYRELAGSPRARSRRPSAGAEPLSIAHVSASMNYGGAERMLADLAAEQVQAGARVAIIAPPGALDRDWASAGVQRIPIPEASRGPVDVARMSVAVAAALRRAAPDVIHAHNVKATGVVLAARSAGRRVPVLTTMHGVAEADGDRAARILRRADLTAAVSDAVRDDVVARGLSAAQVCVVRNGIGSVESVDEARRAAYAAELGLGLRVVSAVGRLVEQKRHERVLEVAAFVRRSHPDVTFLIVGDGPRRAELEVRATELGVQDVVRLTGARDDARALIALSDLLVFSSDWEGLSIAALEALAAATPVVTTDVAGMRELLSGGAGTIVPGRDPADLAGAISALLSDEPRRLEMARIGQQKIAAEFSATVMREQYAAAYRRLLG